MTNLLSSIRRWLRQAFATSVFLGLAATAQGQTYSLNLQKSGEGTVTSSPGGISCAAACSAVSAPYAAGTSVTLNAAPASGYQFSGWLGSCHGFGTCTVSMSSNRNVYAYFDPVRPGNYPLIYWKLGSGSGTLSSTETGSGTINCDPASCSGGMHHYATAGIPITFTASPANGALFAGWSGGACSGTGSTCTVALGGPTVIEATFVTGVVPAYTLTVTKAGTGSGTVTSSPAEINCGSICAANFSAGTLVTLAASAAGGSSFSGWSGEGCAGTGTCTVTMSAARAVTATFVPAAATSYTLTLVKAGAGLGTVISAPGNMNCGPTCTSTSASFTAGSLVTLSATAASGNGFMGWSGGGCSGTLPCTVIMNAAATVTATFSGTTAPPPVFPATVTSNITAQTATVSAAIQYRSQDVGRTASVYVFALAPANLVKAGTDEKAMRVGYAKDERKADTPIACVLAQLSQSGQMVAVTSEQLQAYLTGVLSASGASISILNGVSTPSVAGATFFVGYGATGTTMLDEGVNRSVVTVPGSLVCQPQAPQKGWWWNPREDGRGFSLEVSGNNIFFAAFLYDISGRSTWYVSTGPVSLDGSYYSSDLFSARGGQALGGAYPGFPVLGNVGRMTLTFNAATQGTLVWPGGTVPIERFNIVPNGLNLPPVAGQPESGWWWNEQEAGRGFFMEWQGGNLDIAGYVYDDAGNSVWYLTTGPIGGTASARSFAGNWWSFGNGQTLTGAWKPNARLSSNVAPVTIQFRGPDTAIMTLPNGRTTNLTRHRY